MPQTKFNKKDIFEVRRTKLKPYLNEKEISDLGRRLTKIAHEVDCSDAAALTEAAIETELQNRRGGYVEHAR